MLQLTLCIDALFAIFNQSSQIKLDNYVSQKTTLPRLNSLIQVMDCLFKFIGNRACLAHAFSYLGHLETALFGARV